MVTASHHQLMSPPKPPPQQTHNQPPNQSIHTHQREIEKWRRAQKQSKQQLESASRSKIEALSEHHHPVKPREPRFRLRGLPELRGRRRRTKCSVKRKKRKRFEKWGCEGIGIAARHKVKKKIVRFHGVVFEVNLRSESNR